MSYHPCVSGCGRYLVLSHDCCLTILGIQHAEEAFVDGSCSSCKKGDMTILELHNRLCDVKHGGVPLPLPQSGVRPGTYWRCCVRWKKERQRWFEDYGEGFPKWSSSPFKHSAAGGGAVGSHWDLCRVGHTTDFLRYSPWRTDVDRCIGGRGLSLRGWWLGCVALFGCGSVVRARPRDDGYAFPGRRECRVCVKSSVSRWRSRWF